MTNNIRTLDNDQGQQLNIAGGEYRVIVSGKQTGGAYAIIEMTVPSNAGPVPHMHPGFEETFYVLEGEVSFRSPTGSYLATKGATVSIPTGGPVHNFKNLADTPAKLLCTVVPAGLDDFFIEIADFVINNPSLPKPDLSNSINQISGKYGQTLYSPDYWDQYI